MLYGEDDGGRCSMARMHGGRVLFGEDARWSYS